jgi:hypothetical protein
LSASLSTVGPPKRWASAGLTLLLASEKSDSLTVAATFARSSKRLLMSLRCWLCEFASAYAKTPRSRMSSAAAAPNGNRRRLAADSAVLLRIVWYRVGVR